MVVRVHRGGASLGDLALFYQAFHQGQRLLRSLLDDVGQIYRNVLFLGDLFDFLSLEPRITDPPAGTEPLPAPGGLALRGVTFRYPGAERPVLRDFDLEVPEGGILAVVGKNGAGKSTLVKLLCRLYDPEEGAVEVAGLAARTVPLAELRRRITVLFQEPMHYFTTVAENIAYGAADRTPTSEEIVEAARSAGAEEIVASLPEGYETLLGKWFAGGAELSPGEWQRVALARAFLREAPVLLLDEPTSAMDSWAEADWMERFRDLARGRTVLVITHRFTTARHADRICVMEAGKIVESGTHGELVARGGRYAASWADQVEREGSRG
jgi:ATP-binding cassette subfamily B protein